MICLCYNGSRGKVRYGRTNTEHSSKRKNILARRFFEALQLEFHQYLHALKFIDEHQLSKEALIIDVIIIKKERGVKIEKNIGRI